ncbi:SusC/RagA family TonB-linked outer membrane protein [Chondrinema litorale]|uniref:SusC/RagA family TonB-linked outer membrane protein n=1 Tax=Chondrinema litorale TaxID=2994555 RepID=UPI0025431FA8|nr:TonB-dependent receptor [Chondrinema litorale]UZR99487.1 TonB-dependent receptor [Chondrinema litorale]
MEEIYVSVNLKNTTLEDLFDHIEAQTEFEFAYFTKALDKETRLNIRVSKSSLGNILREVSKEANLAFKRVNDKIYISKKTILTPNLQETIEEGEVAQVAISGVVVSSEDNNPLPGVSILIKGTANGTTTNIDGKYSLTAPSDAILQYSYIGFDTQEIAVGAQSVINITLAPNLEQLEEIVVVGYGTVKKSDLTGSVVSLKSDKINQGVNTSVDELLKGRAAGVSVVQNSSEPGGGVSISIRGASSFTAGTAPLYVIDGLPINNAALTTGSGSFPSSRSPANPLSALNPNDIESIEILKDASATAIYGSRGANGVILITTKKGKSDRMRVNYDGYVGVQNVLGKLDVLNADEYYNVLTELVEDGGGSAEEAVTGIDNGGTDWQDLLLRDNAPVQNHNLSLSGGNEKTSYYAALNYFNQEGVVISSSFERYGARMNVDSKITDKLEVGVNLNTTFSINDLVPAQSYGVNMDNGALYAAYNFDPTLQPYDEDGNYTLSPFHSLDNPLALANGKSSFVKSFRTMGIAYAKYQLLPSLSFKLNLGTDVTNQRKDVYIDRTTVDGNANGGIANIFNENRSNYLVEATTTYSKKFGEHSITALAGVTTQRFFYNGTYTEGRSFPSDVTGTDNIGLGDPTLYVIGSSRAGYQLLSYMGRANYAWKDKYLLTATLRIDGSSRFGNNSKYGYFPSAAFAWKMKEEPFLETVDAISTMKLRASWGQTGNQEIGNYQSITTFAAGGTAVFNVGGASTKISTTAPTRIANPNLKWETTEQWDIGLDFGFLEERVYGSLEYFEKNTFDMLINLPVPTSTGFTTQLTNIGSIKNKGVEFTLNTVNIEGEFNWTSTINLATIRNEVMDLGGIDQIIEGSAGFTGGFFLSEEGETLRSFYGYQVDGVWQNDDDFSVTTDNVAPGDLKYRDVNEDGTVNADDRVILGNSFPDLTWSFGNTLEYKNFGLMIFFEGVNGVSMLNQNLVDTYFPINFRRNKIAEPYLNRWTEDNPSNKYPSFINPGGQGTKQANSYTIEDASYIRLKTVTLSYHLPKLIDSISNASVYLTASNLFTITDYSGIDPAINTNGNAVSRIDYNAYPTAKSVLLGVKLSF